MSDQSQGEGWWIASDGKWYPPHLHPDYQAPAPPPMPEAPPTTRAFSAPSPAAAPASPAPASTAPTTPDGPKASIFAGKSRAQIVVLVSAVVMGIGCFLPWVKVQIFLGSISASGIDGDDGWLFLAAAAVIAVLAWLKEPGVPVLVLSVLTTIGFIYERYDIGTVGDDTPFSITLGIGLWLIAAASLVIFGAAAHRLTASPAGGVAAAPKDGLGPMVRRYWWALAILAALGVGTIVLGTDDHSDDEDVSSIGFDDDDDSSTANFGLDEGTTTTEKRVDAKLSVEDAGFTTYTYYDDSTAAMAGAVIANNGKDDLPSVEVVFNFLGADGKPVGTETTRVPAIEAGGIGHAYVSGVRVTGPVASIDVTTLFDDDNLDFYSPLVLPVSDIALQPQRFGGYTITGTAQNTTSDVQEGTEVDCVVLRGGAVVGGSGTYLDSMPPGQTIAFEVSFTEDVQIDGAACTASSAH
jgi:hypothetical protein